MRPGKPIYAICCALLLAVLAGCGDDGENQGNSVRAPSATPTRLPTPQPISSDLGAAANGGGCYPMAANVDSPLDMLTLIDPEWAPVVNGTVVDSQPVLIHGTVLGGHGDLGGDFPSTHVRSDQNTFVRADDADFGRVAAGNDQNQGALEIAFEWEAGAYPDWAWASAGDRIVGMGRWIFDCGHTGAQPGHCSTTTSEECIVDADCGPGKCAACGVSETCAGVKFGYSSELHPPYATAVMRRGRGAVLSADPVAHAAPATRVDVFVSSYAGGAGDECVLTHLTNPMHQLSVECYPLTRPVAAAHMNDRDFEFDVPLPPRPPGAVHALWRFEERPAPGGIAPTVDVESFETAFEPKVHVRLRLTQATAAGLPTGYAATMVAGWDNDFTPLTHVRVSVLGVVIHNALQPRTPQIPRVCPSNRATCRTSADCPPGDVCQGIGAVKQWRLQVAVNGEWRELSGLQSVNQGDVIPQSIVYDQYLPADGKLSIFSNGIAEDCINAIFGRSLKQDLSELGFADGLTCLSAAQHNAGEVNVTYASPDLGSRSGVMAYETPALGGDGGSCSVTTDRLCVIDTDCPSTESCSRTDGAFALRYRIERVN
jgi:hypothetical protein